MARARKPEAAVGDGLRSYSATISPPDFGRDVSHQRQVAVRLTLPARWVVPWVCFPFSRARLHFTRVFGRDQFVAGKELRMVPALRSSETKQ